jgi:POT family proton-dependent oligopeptide transporter
MPEESTVQRETLFGHPVGLYTLFFAEMWERFSFYGMRALLVLYMIKGFLGYNDVHAMGVYGAYMALVYATGFLGGIFADRLLGQRRAVILGGLLMAAGHLMMTLKNEPAFYFALALLIVGNGFFKPNISTIVGKLYPQNSPLRDGGFTIFYMGVNLGATLSPLMCSYVAAVWGWEYGFGLATIGMLAGLAVFVAPLRVTQFIILSGGLLTATSMFFLQNSRYQLAVNIAAAAALVVAGVISIIALNRGGIPLAAGQPPDMAKLTRRLGPLRLDVMIYLGVLVSVPIFAFLVYQSSIARWILFTLAALCFVSLLVDALRRSAIERERLFVVLILIFFQFVFFAFFEQAGSSLNNFADRNIDRVAEIRRVTSADIGSEIRFRIPIQTDKTEIADLPLLSQEQLGMRNDNPEMRDRIDQAIRLVEATKEEGKRLYGDALAKYVERAVQSNTLNLTSLTALRDATLIEDVPVDLMSLKWTISPDNIGMGVGGDEVPAAIFQAANAGFILIFGVVFTMIWSYLGARGLDPSTPVKFSLGLFQLGLGFVAFWYGAQQADARGMVAISWLLFGYLLHTTGELCLSPVGLSMVTKLSPIQMVGTAMGAWFMATGLANNLAAEIAKLTGVASAGEGPQIIPSPTETVHIYGSVFGKIAIWSGIAALVCLILSPLLTKWMHAEAEGPAKDIAPRAVPLETI